MIAHAGEEFLLVLIPVLIYLAVTSFRAKKRAPAEEPEDEEGRCLYCDKPVDPALDRCPTCGFAVRGRSGKGPGRAGGAA